MNMAYSATPMPRAMTGGMREEKPAPTSVPLSHARYTVAMRPDEVADRQSCFKGSHDECLIGDAETKHEREEHGRGDRWPLPAGAAAARGQRS